MKELLQFIGLCIVIALVAIVINFGLIAPEPPDKQIQGVVTNVSISTGFGRYTTIEFQDGLVATFSGVSYYFYKGKNQTITYDHDGWITSIKIES